MSRTPQAQGKAAREKGMRFQRAVVLLAKALGLSARTGCDPRQDGEPTFRSDAIISGWRIECKHREDLTGRLWEWLTEHDAVVIKRNSSGAGEYSPLAVLPLSRFLEMLWRLKGCPYYPRPCPKCGKALEMRSPPAEARIHAVNWECRTPGCGFTEAIQ